MRQFESEGTADLKELLKIDNLKVHFRMHKGIFSRVSGYVYAVDGVSLSLREGETLGIVGESGCGKTTIGMALMNLIAPTSGKIYFKEKDISQMTSAQLRDLRKEMQIIFQDPYSSLNPRMTLHQILNEPMRIHKMYPDRERKERIAYLLEKVGLTAEHARRYPHELSGGQRQRVGIARALALNPKIIIGDEPVSALDVSIQAQILNLLISLQREFRLSYIIIAHDLAVVEYVCDRIAVMYLGRIVEMASYQNLYNNPKHPYTKALLSAIPIPDPRVSRKNTLLGGDVPSPINPPSGCSFHPRCPYRMDRCDQNVPFLRDQGQDHFVACYLYNHHLGSVNQ
ncbi:MAG: dipeptide ABC transporter ATP-binding protein [Desulfobacterales bacterium]|nr:MAG: dipeptide ABC transporter ATP-binding protein [Desulfobacterales bacterium]